MHPEPSISLTVPAVLVKYNLIYKSKNTPKKQSYAINLMWASHLAGHAVDTHGGSSDYLPSSRELLESCWGKVVLGSQAMTCQTMIPYVRSVHLEKEIEACLPLTVGTVIEVCNLGEGRVG
jgi:hypothetical protein